LQNKTFSLGQDFSEDLFIENQHHDSLSSQLESPESVSPDPEDTEKGSVNFSSLESQNSEGKTPLGQWVTSGTNTKEKWMITDRKIQAEFFILNIFLSSIFNPISLIF
jgi:hypothetical protein